MRSFYYLALILLISCTLAVDPALLAQKFTQAWTAYTSDEGTLCSGKIFYDFNLTSERINFVDSGPNCCGLLDESWTSCSIMQIKDTNYLIIPDIKGCCYISDADVPILPREVLGYFQFNGQKSIDGDKYYWWKMELDGGDLLSVYTDETKKMLWKRLQFTTEDDQFFNVDMWPGSYSEKFNSTSTFEVPKYCKDECQPGLKMKFLGSRVAQMKNMRQNPNQLKTE